MISSAEIAKLAYRLGVGDRVIEKDYILSWLLVALAESELRQVLAFKGGTALKRCYYPDYRFSEDLDFTHRDDLAHDDFVNAFNGLFPGLSRRVGLTLVMSNAEKNVFGSSTLLINYVGPLQARLGSRHLKVDVTRDERLVYPLSERPLQAPYSDFPAGVVIPTYALEEILTEKLCALMGRTEPRDLYDVYCLFEFDDVDLSLLAVNFAAKCRHKGHDLNQLGEALVGKTLTFEKLWMRRLAVQVVQLPRLDDVLRIVRRHLRGMDLVE